MQLTRLIYFSRRRDSANEVLDSILRMSRNNNQGNAITGALIASEDHFLQVLEGRRVEVTRCFGRILRDSRHADVQIVAAGEVRGRLFPQWSMHRIHTSEVRGDVLRSSLVDGVFQPDRLSQHQIENLCHALSRGGLQTTSPVPVRKAQVPPWSSADRR